MLFLKNLTVKLFSVKLSNQIRQHPLVNDPLLLLLLLLSLALLYMQIMSLGVLLIRYTVLSRLCKKGMYNILRDYQTEVTNRKISLQISNTTICYPQADRGKTYRESDGEVKQS